MQFTSLLSHVHTLRPAAAAESTGPFLPTHTLTYEEEEEGETPPPFQPECTYTPLPPSLCVRGLEFPV